MSGGAVLNIAFTLSLFSCFLCRVHFFTLVTNVMSNTSYHSNTNITRNVYKCIVTSVTCVISMGQNKARFGLTMSPDLLKQIDKDRGLIARATYIEFSMKKYFELKNFIDEEIKFYEEDQARFTFKK